MNRNNTFQLGVRRIYFGDVLRLGRITPKPSWGRLGHVDARGAARVDGPGADAARMRQSVGGARHHPVRASRSSMLVMPTRAGAVTDSTAMAVHARL
ncbi:hypothetical protein [Streptomyces hydrogenans]|uniref:hypothetical protein n=1 Tax=Streptomyces hydrogenans TaxID=1873719 RepID=UPI0036AD59AF